MGSRGKGPRLRLSRLRAAAARARVSLATSGQSEAALGEQGVRRRVGAGSPTPTTSPKGGVDGFRGHVGMLPRMTVRVDDYWRRVSVDGGTSNGE